MHGNALSLAAGMGVRVASYGVAAAYAGWLLRQMGAEVEHENALDPEGMGAFLGEGGTSVDRPRIRGLDDGVVITDAPVTAENRRAVETVDAPVLWISPWGLDDEVAGVPATDLILHAAGGWMAAVGEPEGPPLGPPGSLGQFAAGLFAAVEALALAVLHRAEPQPRLVSVSVFEAVAATTIYDAIAFQYYGRVRARAGNRFAVTQPTIMTLPCADGYVGIHAALHPQWLALCSAIGHPQLAEDPRFATSPARTENLAELDREYLLPWLASRTRWEVYHHLQAARIPCSPLPTPNEVLDWEQLEVRKVWREVVTPGGRRLKVPGPPARVVGEASGGNGAARADGPWAPGRLRVVDLSMGWAGPLVSHLLACHGADVIKVESHRRFDWWRGSRPPGDDPELVLHERSHVFNAVNRGKRGLTLDLTAREGRDLAFRLIAGADVVVENFGDGVMERLGLGYETLSAANPGLVMLRQPAFGSGGPESGYVAFGNTIEGMSGLTSLTGPEGGPPYMLSNALGDPISGLNGTVAVLAGLAGRQRDGRGRCIEAAQIEGFLPLVADALIATQTGQPPERHGNSRPSAVISGVFRCEGEDAWVAVEVRDGQECAALETVVGSMSEAPEATFASWAAGRNVEEVVRACRAAGVAVEAVANEPGTLADDRLAGFWVPDERAVVGLHLYPSVPVVVDGERRLPGRPAPLLGEHNDEVLAGLGIDGAGLASLAEAGVIGQRPA